VIGHPFNPPLVMPLVEVVPGKQTSAATTKAATDFYLSVGKQPIVVGKELPGFVANRLQNALVREAFSLVLDGVVTPTELDAVVTCSLGLRWAAAGPFLALRLGGGPGGFTHIAAHIGPEMGRMWATLGNPNADSETFQHVGELVDGAYSDSPIPEQAALRDERQVTILQSLARIDQQR
jgi:ketoreductase RED1